MALYFFFLALCLVPVTIVAGALTASFRFVRHLANLRRAEFSVSATRVRPGETFQAIAHVVPRSARAVTVQANLTCTMFDHRPHELYSSSRQMIPGAAGSNQYAVDLALPAYALRTGRVGDESPLAENAHRMLVVWTVDFVVRAPSGTLLCQRSRAFEVPQGRRAKTILRRMSLLALDTFSSVRNDMLFNWLVHLAVCDGPMTPPERTLLADLVSEMDGMADAEAAGMRIERELQRRLQIDDKFLRRYVPLDARLEFYRALLMLALTDGAVGDEEKAFLDDAGKALGMTGEDVKHIEEEVARAPKSDSPS